MKRFFDKINKTDSCWNFTGALRQGYGCLKIKGKIISAHRYSWEFHNGIIHDGLFVCHSCDNRKCVNPDHLFLGTHSDNMKDAYKKNRIIIPVASHFKNGHYPKNTKVSLCDAIEIKGKILNRGSKTLKSISLEYNVSYQFIRDISCGRILRDR